MSPGNEPESIDPVAARLQRELELAAAEASLHGDELQAVRFLTAAQCLAVGDATMHNRLGVSLYSLGDRDFAQACFERALRLDPHNEDAKGNLDALANA